MKRDIGTQLGRRERQIVEVLYRLGKASVAEVLAELPDPPSYSAVRGMLALLEDKGHVRHKREGMRYIYTPAVSPAKARQSALRQLVSTFFEGSPMAAAASLLEMSDEGLSAEERGQLSALIARREREGR
jgi:BlaI family transcriptional regulator, penicillinase repressor